MSRPRPRSSRPVARPRSRARTWRILLVIAAVPPLLVAAQAIPVPPLPTPAEALAGLFPSKRESGPEANAPPLVRFAEPVNGSGFLGPLRVSGVAFDNDTGVAEVHVRVGTRVWVPADVHGRGGRAVSWSLTIESLPPGDHALRARAKDMRGALSIPAAVLVRAGHQVPPPTVILAEPEGTGMDAHETFLLTGVVAGAPGGGQVVLRADDGFTTAASVPSGSPATPFTILVPGGSLTPGMRTLRAHALAKGVIEADAASLPQELRLAAGSGASPATVRILSPAPGSGVSSMGTPGCIAVKPCVAVTGTAFGGDGPQRLEVSIDGLPWHPLEAFPGAEATRLARAPRVPHAPPPPQTPETSGALGGLAWRFEWPLPGQFAGRHTFHVRAMPSEGRDGLHSVPASASIALASLRELAIVFPGGAEPWTHETVLARAREPNGRIHEVEWFLDETFASRGHELSTRFTRAGSREVVARLQDARHYVAAEAVSSLEVRNRPPGASLHVETRRVAAEPVFFSAEGSTDSDGVVTHHLFDFGDGATSGWIERPLANHTYAREGSYVVSLRVRDDHDAESDRVSEPITVANALPEAVFGYEPLDPDFFTTVRFYDRSVDPDGSIVERKWEFGDGTGGKGERPTHRFPRRGPFTVTLTVTDASGATATTTGVVEVRNLPARASLHVLDEDPEARSPTRFAGYAEKTDGHVDAYEWSFGDGGRGFGRNVSHAYAAEGAYRVTLRVKDDWGAVSLAETLVRVASARPVLDVTLDPPAPEALAEVAARVIARDPDGNVTRIEWDFGDGTRSNATEVLHRFPRAGRHDVTVRAWDDRGRVATMVVPVHVSDARPTVEIRAPARVVAGHAALFESRATDPDGRIVRWAWDMNGDGEPEHVDGTAGHVLHTFARPGTYRVALTVTDASGQETTTRRLVDVTPPPPGTVPPTVEFGFPTWNATVAGAIDVSGRAFGPMDVVRVELQIRHDEWTLDVFGEPWSRPNGRPEDRWRFTLDTRILNDGDYQLVARATDERGTSGEAVVPFRVRNALDLERQRISVQVLAPERAVNGTVVLKGTAYHPERLESVRVSIDGGPWRDATLWGANWHLEVDSTKLGNGAHRVVARAVRDATLSRDAEGTLLVENRHPVLVVRKAPERLVYDNFTFSGTLAPGSPPAEVYWRVDRFPWRLAWGSPGWTFRLGSREYSPGPHVVEIKAVAANGLESAVSRHEVEFLPALEALRSESKSIGVGEARAPAAGLVASLAAAGLAGLLASQRGAPRAGGFSGRVGDPHRGPVEDAGSPAPFGVDERAEASGRTPRDP